MKPTNSYQQVLKVALSMHGNISISAIQGDNCNKVKFIGYKNGEVIEVKEIAVNEKIYNMVKWYKEW